MTPLPFEQLAAEVAMLNPRCLLSKEDAAALMKIVPTDEEAAAGDCF